MRTWQSQDACAQSRHSEPCKQSSWLGNRRKTGLSSQQVVWAPEVPPGPLLFHEKRPWWGWYEADGKSPELGLNSGISALSQGHNHYTTQPPHTHTHAHTHTHTHTHAPHISDLMYELSNCPSLFLGMWFFSVLTLRGWIVTNCLQIFGHCGLDEFKG